MGERKAFLVRLDPAVPLYALYQRARSLGLLVQPGPLVRVEPKLAPDVFALRALALGLDDLVADSVH